MQNRLPPLNSLKAFEAAARHMSFKQAAGELHVTPSALSYQIRQLEDHLGLPLFHRLNREVRLTDAGARVYPGLREGFARFEEAIARVRAVTPDNILVVSTGPAFAAKWLAPRIYRFVDRFPDIEIRISANLGLVDFAHDEVDIGIRFGAGHYPDLVSKPLANEWISPMAAPDFIARNNLRRPEDLAGIALLHDESLSFRHDAPSWRQWFELAGVSGIDPDRGPRFNHADHAMDAAARGAGVALARSMLAADDIQTGRLALLFPDLRLDTGFGFHLVYPPAGAERRKIQVFRDWMFEQMAEPGAVLE